MQLIILCLGLLSCAYLGDCVEVWTAPTGVPSGGGDAGVVETLVQGAASALTITVTSATAMSIVSQVPDAHFAALTFAAPTGTLVLASGKTIDYEAFSTHVLVISATAGATESATMTISVYPLYFLQPSVCATIKAPFAAAAQLYEQLATGATTITNVQTSATTGYTFATDGKIKTTAAITSSTAATKAIIVSTASEAHGTASTITSTVVLCINGGCDCSTYDFPSSEASIFTAGLLSFIMLLFMKIN